MQIKSVGFFGGTNLQDGSVGYLALEVLGRQLASRGITVVTGALGGAMEAPAKGAASAGGQTVGYTLLGLRPNPHIKESVDCSIFHGKKIAMELQFGVRLGNLISAEAFIFAAEGGIGTIVELAAICNFNGRGWEPQKKVAILDPLGSWKSLLGSFVELGFLSLSAKENIKLFSTEEGIVDWICEE